MRNRALDHLADRGQPEIGPARYRLAQRVVADDERIGLRADEQADRHLQVARVANGTLPLDDVPVPRIVVRREHLGRAGDEVGNDRVDRDAVARDHDAGLAGRPEGAVEASAAQLAVDRERGVLLAARAVGADRQDAAAGALAPGADRKPGRRYADVHEPRAGRRRRVGEPRQAREADMQSGNNVDSERRGLAKRRNPRRWYSAADGGRADHEALGTGRTRLADRHVRDAGIDAAARQTHLAQAIVAAPVDETETGLAKDVARDVAEEDDEGRVEVRNGHAATTPALRARRHRLLRPGTRRPAPRERRRPEGQNFAPSCRPRVFGCITVATPVWLTPPSLVYSVIPREFVRLLPNNSIVYLPLSRPSRRFSALYVGSFAWSSITPPFELKPE